jgi:F-type H+-transporting ATPase subunit epsilon
MSTTEFATSALRVIVVTPEETVLDIAADFVALPLFDGEVGIGKDHSPMIGRLGYGELRVKVEGTTSRYYIDGGFVQVNDNLVSVLTNRAIPAAAVDEVLAAEQLATAITRKFSGEEELAIRDRLMAQARAQLRVAEKAKSK